MTESRPVAASSSRLEFGELIDDLSTGWPDRKFRAQLDNRQSCDISVNDIKSRKGACIFRAPLTFYQIDTGRRREGILTRDVNLPELDGLRGRQKAGYPKTEPPYCRFTSPTAFL